MYSLTAVIPFYNEEDFLQDSFERLLSSGVADKILLVDDSSTDRSKEIAINIANKHSNVSYFLNKSNKGKGSALISIKEHIQTSHMVIHDADLEYDPNDLIKLKKLSIENKNSLILGSRFIGSIERNNLYKSTHAANQFLSLLFSIINSYKITDIATCYKMFPAKFFKNTNFKEKGFSIEIEILAKFLKYNTSVFELPIHYSGRSYSQGKKIHIKDGFYYIFNIFKYRF
jgi:glycosyltransferase involved in cell wall biosynthesis